MSTSPSRTPSPLPNWDLAFLASKPQVQSHKQRRAQKSKSKSSSSSDSSSDELGGGRQNENAILILKTHPSILSPTLANNPSSRAFKMGPPVSNPIRLFVASIGNPAPYTNTLHSAGHVVLTTLAARLSYPAFRKTKESGNGISSELSLNDDSSPFQFWQSASMMNVSGKALSTPWRTFKAQMLARGYEPRLVVVHDEMELKLGKVKTRDGLLSAKGHNGLLSIQNVVQTFGDGVRYKRIGVGIGRPVSREPKDVANYVLKKISEPERRGIEGAVGEVEVELKKLLVG